MLHLSALHPPYPQPHFDTPPLTRHHPAPAHPRAGVWGYWSTDGLGLFEYMLLAEELGAEAIWVVNNGVAHGDSEPLTLLSGCCPACMGIALGVPLVTCTYRPYQTHPVAVPNPSA